MTTRSSQEAVEKVRALAATNPEFRQKLADDPHAAVAEALGAGEMDEAQLETVSGGVLWPLGPLVDWVVNHVFGGDGPSNG